MTLLYRHWLIAAALSAVFLTSCSTAPGTVLGLPISAPKSLKGTVGNNTYISPDKQFSVRLPYDESTDYWKYMPVTEGSDKDHIHYVVFGPIIGPSIGPVTFDPNEYHVTYSRKAGNAPFSAASAEKVFQHYNQQLEVKLKTPVEKITAVELVINNRKAVYAVYRHSVPIGKSRLMKATRHFVYCLIDFDSHVANFIAVLPLEGNERAKQREARIVARDLVPFERLTHGFQKLGLQN